MAHGDEKHIADILINDYIVEFQHSSISLNDFEARNSFYSSCGYKVIWVFDLEEEFSSEKIYKYYGSNEYSWSYPKKLFREMDFKSVQATIYFQFDYCNDENVGVLERVTGGYNRFTQFYTDTRNVLSIPEFIKLLTEGDSKISPQKYDPPVVPDSVDEGKTIYELWKSKYSGIIVKNLVIGNEMLINGKDGRMYRRGHYPNEKIIGKYSNFYGGKYHYSDYYPVWDEDKAIWTLKVEFISQEYLEREKIHNEIVNRNIAGKKLISLLISTEGQIFHCLLNNKYYLFEFINDNRMVFNAYEFDPPNGEVVGTHCNKEVHKLENELVWEEYIEEE